MRVPNGTYHLSPGLTCKPFEPPIGVWQDHVIRHVFGTEALFGDQRPGPRPWNAEGWDRLLPPVITADQRPKLVEQILALEVNGARCRVPRLPRESYAGEPPAGWQACQECPVLLATKCEGTTLQVDTKYRDVVDELLGTLSGTDGKIVSRTDLLRNLVKMWRTPARLAGLVVLSAGLANNERAIIARASRWDGVRVEFYLQGAVLKWRTTWREVPGGTPRQISFIAEFPEAPSGPARPRLDAASCLVPRQWAEVNGVL